MSRAIDKAASALADANTPRPSGGESTKTLSASRRQFPEAWWTTAAVGLTLATGGTMLWLISFSGGTWWLDDFQSQWMPSYMEMNRALREGSYPLLSPESWYGGDFAGEYQYGVFSLAHLAIVFFVFQWNLSLLNSVTLLVAIYAAILSSGVFRLGRRLGLTIPNAMLASLATTLNGYTFVWGAQNWFPAFASFAWLPWVWWAMEFALRPSNPPTAENPASSVEADSAGSRYGCWRFLPAALLIYLLLTAGWPFTVLMAGVVTLWLVVRDIQVLRTRIWPAPAAWVLGFALASPAILALLEYHSFTTRSSTWLAASASWTMPLSAFGGTIIPPMPASGTFYSNIDVGPMGLRHSYEASCGLVPCVALLAILIRRWDRFIRKRRWELMLLVLTVILCFWGELGAFRWSFRWLPLFHLTLGLLGGFALQDWSLPNEPAFDDERHSAWFTRFGVWLRILFAALLVGVCIESPRTVRTIVFGLVLVLLIALVHWLRGMPWWEKSRIRIALARWSEYPGFWSCLFVLAALAYVWIVVPAFMPPQFTMIGLTFLGISVVWMLASRLFPAASLVGTWLPVAITAVCLAVGTYRSDQRLPRWPFSEMMCQPGPLDKARMYLVVQTRKDVFTEEADVGEINRFGNTAMYAGLSFFNGYTPMHPQQLARVFSIGGMGQRPASGRRILNNYIAAGGLLSQMGIDGLILGRDFSQYADLVRQSGWDLVGYFPHGIVFHRPGSPASRVRSLSSIVAVDLDGKTTTESVSGTAKVRDIRESRLSVGCHVENASLDREALVAFSRAYYPGYRAYLNGIPVPVESISGIQPGVRIPPKASGELLLVFLPESVRRGAMIAAVAVMATVVCLIVGRLRNRYGSSKQC